MEATIQNVLAFYPPAPSNGGRLEGAPEKVGEWVWQPKVDDWRGAVHAPTKEVWNQYGERSTVAQQGKITYALECLQGEWKRDLQGFEWFDVGIMENRHDMMRGALIVFDVMDSGLIHSERRAILEQMFPILPIAHRLLANGKVRGGVYLINEWRNQTHPEMLRPMTLQALLQRENELVGHKFYEGLVAKRADALYPTAYKAKQKTNVWVKHRFDQ